MLFVIHATDKKEGMATRAKFYRAHRIHLDQAEDLARRAQAVKGVHWGYFDDTPDTLLRDIHAARGGRNQQDAVRLLAEAQQLFQEGNLAEARKRAKLAGDLHGTYRLLEVNRAQQLLAAIDAAELPPK